VQAAKEADMDVTAILLKDGGRSEGWKRVGHL